MRSYYIVSHGKLIKKDNTLMFQNKTKEQVIPIEDIKDVFIIASVSITSEVLKLFSKKGVVVHFFSVYGNYIGSFFPKNENELGSLIISQVRHYEDREKRLYLAKEFIKGAISNCGKLLDIEFDSFLQKLKGVNTISELMGIEANFRKLYYKSLEAKAELYFGKRTKRPPTTELNALISFGNSLLYGKIASQIYSSSLNIHISYLHEINQKRFSLALDLSEIFKPIIVDFVILKLAKENVFQKGFFKRQKDKLLLTNIGFKTFIKAFDDRFNETIKIDEKEYTLATAIKMEIIKLIKHFEAKELYKALVI
ncbi:type I-B CRISPR-associated endonuclease Cas1b [Hydrogenobaculum acidophilum]